MNNTNVPTVEKMMLPLRIPKELYVKIIYKVNEKKEKTRGYSINQYLTELIEKDLK